MARRMAAGRFSWSKGGWRNESRGWDGSSCFCRRVYSAGAIGRCKRERDGWTEERSLGRTSPFLYALDC